MNSVSLVEEETDMPLSTENQTWVIEEINRAIRKAINPLGRTKKLLHALRDWGLATTIVMVPVALLAGVITLGIRVVSDIRDEASFRTHTDDRLTAIETGLAALRIAHASSDPTKTSNQIEAAEVLATVKKASIFLPTAIVQDAGKRFIEASTDNPEAWKVALDCISYRSSLSDPSRPKPTEPKMAAVMTNYGVLGLDPEGKTFPRFWTAGPLVAASLGASWDLIGNDQNVKVNPQPMWLIGQGGAVILDNCHLRHAILTGSEVHYLGGPIIMEDVIFINCTFIFANSNNSRDLGEKLLISTTVDFSGLDTKPEPPRS